MPRSNPQYISGYVCRACPSKLVSSSPRSFIASSVGSVALPRLAISNSRSPVSRTRWASTDAGSTKIDRSERKKPAKAGVPQETEDPFRLARIAEETRDKFLAEEGIPSQQLTADALQSCLRAAVAIHPRLKRAEAQTKASASKLVMLGAERTGASLPIDAQLNDAINKISASAYGVVAHPNVDITPQLLGLYVRIQAQLGRPEPLPAVLEMFAHKRKPVLKDGQIQYVSQNPKSLSKAVEVPTAEMALQTAIEAKHLDAALGVIEATYALSAFRRQKLVKYGSAPALGLASAPLGIMGLATAYATFWQNTMDVSTATGIGVAGISGYFLAVGSMGVIAKLTFKDQMRRVTWAPGTPLGQRWMREEERAALDKVACAWGFKETWRHGEETGPEWEGLKEYMGYRGMLLDRVEFMEGMS